MHNPEQQPVVLAEPIDPKRVRAFAAFFKRYMSLSTVVVASLPIPVTAFGLIPTYAVHSKPLSVYTPLFCFLTLGLIFYSRHQLARLMFPEHFGEVRNILTRARPPLGLKLIRKSLIGFLPFLFITSSVVCLFLYHTRLADSVDRIFLNQYMSTRIAVVASRKTQSPLPDDGTSRRPSADDVFKNADLFEIPHGTQLMLLYIAVFTFAEAAFILMAIKEYLQDLVGLSELDLIRGPKTTIED
jgi:hypothetical protein